MTNTHRAVIEYPAPPMVELIASGDRDFCSNALVKWLVKHPVTPYNEDDPVSGGEPLILRNVTRDMEINFDLISGGLKESEAQEPTAPESDPEVAIISRVLNFLENEFRDLDQPDKARILRWVISRFRLEPWMKP